LIRHLFLGMTAAAALATSCTATSSTATSSTATTATSTAAGTTTFKADVWADNWFALYVNGTKVGEDPVPITTERSFNAETITFSAGYPLTIGLVAKDYKADDTGLEYLGTDRQQLGDAGVIAQITDLSTGRVVDATGAAWRGLVVHTAPTNKACATSATPETDCRFTTRPEPDGWTDAAFDDTSWTAATVYTAQQVGVKDGYDTIRWDASAALIWSADLQADNTVLWRHRITGP